ncbi:MAG: hypothetical protein JZU55_02725 [Afipia sp.]|nr:hypothetical protein [Afipia sp.]
MRRDDWEKPRSKGQHLTATEIAFIKSEFLNGTKAHDTARALKCSSRIVSKYYGFFVAEGCVSGNRAPFDPAKARSDRFYKSNFELDDKVSA